MKKLIFTMVMALLVFGMSISAWAAPATQDTSCSANSILSKPGSIVSQAGSGTDLNALLDSLKNSSDASKSTQAGKSLEDLFKSYGLDITNISTKNINDTSRSALFNNLNSLLEKYGIEADIFSFFRNGSTGRPGQDTDKPSPAPGDNDTDEPSPAPGDNDTDEPSPTPDDNDTKTPSPSDNIDNLSYEQQVVKLVNEHRAANGLAPLTLNEKLSEVARAKSQDMRDNNYFSHTSPTYGSPFDMLKTFGVSYRAAGENIAMGYSTPEAVVNGWMNSSGHRANILNSSYTQIGVGYVADGHYWTQLFTN